MNVPLSSCSCHRCCALKLEGRIKIIGEFESHRSKKPSIKSLAAKFDCCYTEIKHILLNRENILFVYENTRKQKNKPPLGNDELSKRQKKLGFLGKVMYEYLQRILYSKYAIDEEKVLQKAQEFKFYIGVEHFEPSRTWLEDFKRTYDISGFDIKSLRDTITLSEAKRPQLSARDVVEYVRRQEREAQNTNGTTANKLGINKHRSNDDRYKHSNDPFLEQMSENEKRSNGQQHQYNGNKGNSNYMLEPTVVYETIEDSDDDVVANYGGAHNNNKSTNHHNNSTVGHSSSKRRHTSNLTSIESVQEALDHLKILEEYAMLQDNYRAIGLLTQLEQVFKKQTN